MLNILNKKKNISCPFHHNLSCEGWNNIKVKSSTKAKLLPGATVCVSLIRIFLPAGEFSCFSAMFPYGFGNFNNFHWAVQVFLTGFFCFLQPLCSNFSLLFLRGPYGRGAALAVRLNHQLSYREKPSFQWHCDCLCEQPWVCLRGAIRFCWRLSGGGGGINRARGGGGGGINRAGRVSLEWHVWHRILPVGWNWGPVVTNTVSFFCLYFFLQLIKWFLMGTNSQILIGGRKPGNR